MPAPSTSQKQNWHRGRSYVAAPALSDTCNGAPLDPAEFVQSQAEDVAARREPGCRQLARRLCACPQQNFFGSEFSPDTQTRLVSSMAWCCFRRLRLSNFRPAQIKECPHDDRYYWSLRASRIGCDICLDLSDKKCIR